MTVDELIERLENYAGDQPVKIFDDWGSSFILHPIEKVFESTELESTQDPVVVISFEVGED